MRQLRLSGPATQVMGALRRQHHGDRPMGDLLSGLTTGISNEISQAPNTLLSGLVGNIAAQPGVKAAASTATKNAAASQLATQITALMNNPMQLAMVAGGGIVLLVVLAKVLK